MSIKLTCYFVSIFIRRLLFAGILLSHYCLPAQLPVGYSDELVQSGYNTIMGSVFTEDGSKMFVWEKSGRVYVSNFDGTTYVKQNQPVLDISDEVGDWRDFGFLSFCLDPDFDNNGLVYMFYVVDRHHLLNFGTPDYNPNTNQYFAASISRVTRYQLNLGSSPLTTDYNSRFVLLGESISTGVPLTHESHAGGTILFGDDGTLIVSTGDNASYNSVDQGSANETYYQQAIDDGIMRPEENVGAYRSQQITSLCGKVLRLDPDTGDGIPSNPFYESSNPRSAKSRMYAMGFRNPFRMSIQRGSGSSNPADANPGILFVADVGWFSWEDLHVLDKPGLNAGWPLYEGQTTMSNYWNTNTTNPDENNERFKDNCLQPSSFVDNPNPALRRFIHNRPEVAWRHGSSNEARVPWFNGTTPTNPRIGSANSPTTGVEFRGNTGVAGTYIHGIGMGSSMTGKYFFTDYIRNWIHVASLNDGTLNWFNNIDLFAPVGFGQGIVHMAENPLDGFVYYSNIFNGQLRRLTFDGPTWTIEPTDLTLECSSELDINDEFANWLSGFSGTVGCGTANLTNNSEGLQSNCGNTFFEEVTFTLSDGCGNQISKIATFSIVDTTAPAAPTAPEAATYECIDEVPASVELTAIDNCDGDITAIGSDAIDNTNPCEVIITRTWTFTDSCNNESSISQIITVADTTAPAAPTAPEAATYECIDEVPVAVELTATDNCGGDITVIGTDSIDTTNPCEVIITRTWTFTDSCNNESSISQIITVADTTAPTAPTAPEALNYQCLDEVPPAIELTAIDNCDGDIIAIGTDAIDNTNPCEVIITRTWTFTDSCNNESSIWQIITVADTTAPTAPAAPEAATYQCIDEVPVAAELTATDNCGGDITDIGTDSIDTTNPCEVIITRTWTFTDSCNNESSISQIITVADTTAPTAPTAPEAATYQCIDEVPASVELTATDNCDGDITAIGSDAIDNTNPCEVIITRTWTFTDSCNNESSISQIITVADTTAPTAPAAPEAATYQCIDEVPASVELTATDNCGGDITVTGTDSIDTTNPCEVIITRTWTFTDSCNNESSVSQIITVADTTAPQWDIAPTDIIISCPENIVDQFVIWLNRFTALPDNCSNVTISNDNVDFVLECGETRTVTFTLSDDCGNTTSAAADFTIEATLNLSNFDLTKIRLYPNPTNSQFTVSGLSEISQLTVYNLSGQLIMKQEVENNSILKLNVEAGIYIVKIEQKDNFLVKRLIVN